MADSSQVSQGGPKVKEPCQLTIVGVACAELVILKRIAELPDLRKGILKQGLKKKHWVDFYHYRMDVYTHFEHTYIFKQLVKWMTTSMTT